jgi:transcriptional regulator
MDDEGAWRVVHEAGAGVFVRASATGLLSVFAPVTLSDGRSILRTHIAKANEFWRDLADGDEVLIIFLAASAYVSPSNYPSRLEGANHVPTWNYVAAEVRGQVRVITERDWLHEQTGAVTQRFESGRDPEWHVSETSAEYLEKQYHAIVGLEVTVTSIEGKAKLSQNRLDGDRETVRDALAAGTPSDQIVAHWMQR